MPNRCFLLTIAANKTKGPGPGKPKEESTESKRKELEKKLQDVSSQLGLPGTSGGPAAAGPNRGKGGKKGMLISRWRVFDGFQYNVTDPYNFTDSENSHGQDGAGGPSRLSASSSSSSDSDSSSSSSSSSSSDSSDSESG